MPRKATIPQNFGYRPFTLADARAVGLSDSFVRGSLFRRIFRGVYIRDEVPGSAEVRFDAARRLTSAELWATCHTAAELYGGPVPADPHTHVGLPAWESRPRGPGLVAHRYHGTPRLTRIRGRPVATAEHLFVQLAGYLDLVDLVIVGDALVRLRRTTPERFIEAAGAAQGRGSRIARRAAALVRERVDSAMETRSRLLVVLAGLPEPEVNKDAYDESGGWIARPDLSYPWLRIALEYDGSDHTKPRQRHKDIRRRELYDTHGWRVLIITSRDIFEFPSQTLVRVLMVLQERRHPGVPRELSDEWRRHFPVRPARPAAF